jgi:hypothetical protein
MSQYNNRKQFNTSKSASNEVKKFCKVCQDAGKPESMYTSHFVRDRPGPDGKVVCPTLLSQNCRGCGKSGHTYKYCKVVIQQDLEKKQQDKLEENEKKWKSAEKKLEESVKRPVPQKKETVIKVLKGAYASILLSSSSDEDSDDEEQPKAAHPKKPEVDSFKNVRFIEHEEELPPRPQPVVESNPNSYAARLRKPVPVPVKPVPPPSMEEFVIQEPPKPIGFKIVSLPKTVKPVRKPEESLVAPRVITEEQKRKLNETINVVLSKPCNWDDDVESSDEESDDEEEKKEEPKVIFKKKEPVKTNVFIELKDAWSDDEA